MHALVDAEILGSGGIVKGNENMEKDSTPEDRAKRGALLMRAIEAIRRADSLLNKFVPVEVVADEAFATGRERDEKDFNRYIGVEYNLAFAINDADGKWCVCVRAYWNAAAETEFDQESFLDVLWTRALTTADGATQMAACKQLPKLMNLVFDNMKAQNATVERSLDEVDAMLAAQGHATLCGG